MFGRHIFFESIRSYNILPKKYVSIKMCVNISSDHCFPWESVWATHIFRKYLGKRTFEKYVSSKMCEALFKIIITVLGKVFGRRMCFGSTRSKILSKKYVSSNMCVNICLEMDHSRKHSYSYYNYLVDFLQKKFLSIFKIQLIPYLFQSKLTHFQTYFDKCS